MMPLPSTRCSFAQQEGRATRSSRWIIQYLLPVGWFALLTGLFWIGDRALFHKLYYALLAVPTLVAATLQPALIGRLLRHTLIAAFVVFAAYTCLTLLWSDTDTDTASMIKRPIYVLMLLLSAGLISLQHPSTLAKTLSMAAAFATLSGAASLAYFVYDSDLDLGNLSRFTGYGALYNPLLSSHVYGFFAAFWLATWFANKNPFAPAPLLSLLVLFAVVISTGSRTPLLALSITALWLAVAHFNRRSAILVLLGAFAGLCLLFFYPTSLTARGLSYRPEIWLSAIELAQEKLWFGHGYDHSLMLPLENSTLAFNDPHNIELAVLLSGGMLGLIMWLALYGLALGYSWRNRSNPMVLTASALIIFGLIAGMTEGRDFLSRPKEHWFLIWIPFALLIGSWLSATQRHLEMHKIEKETGRQL